MIQNDFSFSFSPTKDNTLFIQRVLGKLFFDFSSKLQPPTSILIRPMTVKILVINPNSSEKVTKNLEKQLLNRKMFNCFLYRSIRFTKRNHPTTSLQSEKAVLEDFKVNIEDRLNYDGYLVCCYSDHPLVYSLGKLTKKPVMGIMQATLLFALLQPTTKQQDCLF